MRYLYSEIDGDLVEPSRESIRRGASYLASRAQRIVNHGKIVNGWGRELEDEPNPSCTAMAMIALTEALNVVSDDEIPGIIDRAMSFLCTNQFQDGTWSSVSEHHRDFTFIRLPTPYILIASLLQQAKLHQEPVVSAINWVLGSFHSDGYVEYTQSDIVAWPTRDCLMALAYLLRKMERPEFNGDL